MESDLHLLMMGNFRDLSDKLQVRLFLKTKALLQVIGANPKQTPPDLVVFVSGVHRSGTSMMTRMLREA